MTGPAEPLAGVVAREWARRLTLEQEAAAHFTWLTGEVERVDPGSPVVGLLARAAEDERRHVTLCREILALLGAPGTGEPQTPGVNPSVRQPRRLAPVDLAGPDGITYEVLAACCISETVTVAMLTAMLPDMPPGSVKRVIREVARDELTHARIGWAHLARVRAAGDPRRVGAWVPAMLLPSWSDAPVEQRNIPDAELLGWGILPATRRRKVFLDVLEEVILPGLSTLGVDPGPARAWASHLA